MKHSIQQAVCALAIALPSVSARAQANIEYTITAQPGPWTLHAGRTTTAWMYDAALPGPTLRATEGDTVRVRLLNRLPEPTTIHWHGLPNTVLQDGVPESAPVVVEPGQEHTYVIRAAPPGTYWFHPHVGLQLDQGLYGLLIVDPLVPDPPAQRDFAIVLDDWIDGPPVIVPQPAYTEYLINGKSSLGQSAMVVAQGETVRLRFLNASAATNYVVAVDQHPMTVIRADGQRVVPVARQAIPIGMGERYDVLITANNPGVWSIAASSITNRNVTLVRAVMQYQGQTGAWPSPDYEPPFLRTGTLLSYAALAAQGPVSPIAATPDRVHDLTLGSGSIGGQTVFTINGQAFPNADPLDVVLGEDVRFRMMSMMGGPHHPMHIHGHFFRLIGSGGGNSAPLVKDTLLVPPMSTVEAEFVADNPGNWAFHCHHAYHMAMGMMRMLRYVGTDSDGDLVSDDLDYDPAGARPVLWLDSLGAGFGIGTSYSVAVQWAPFQNVTYVVGGPLAPPRPFGAWGDLYVGPRSLLGRAQTGSDGISTLPATIANDPSLIGVPLAVQALAMHPTLAGGARFSTCEILTPQP